MGRRPSVGQGLLLLALALATAGRAVALPVAESILPLEAHAPDMRPLAQDHAAELRGLYDEVTRCAPGLEVEKHGIAFRRPKGGPATAVHLTLWVWLDQARPLPGAT